MSLQHNFSLLARYNQWMNNKLYQLASTLRPDELLEHRGAFFGSVAGILNHLLVADLIWLNRFSQLATQPQSLLPLQQLPLPTALDQLLYQDFTQLYQARQHIDCLILAFVAELDETQLQHLLSYKNMKGELMQKKLASVMQHLFNHQTHHRGQLTTLFSQMGLDVGVTDLLMLIDNELTDEH